MLGVVSHGVASLIAAEEKRMKKPAFLGVVSLLFLTSAAEGAVLTFDDLPVPGLLDQTTIGEPMPLDYGGLSWGSHWGYGPPPVNSQGTLPAGDYVAFNTYCANSLNIYSDSDFDFIGTDLGLYAGLGHDQQGLADVLYVEGYNNGTLVYSQPITLDPNYGLTWVGVDYYGVDSVTFRTRFDLPLTMNNFTYETSRTVPEPPSLLVLSIGFLVLAFLAGCFRASEGVRPRDAAL